MTSLGATPYPAPADLEDAFAKLAARWREDTAHYSSAAKMAEHPAYQQIIAMGKAVVPLILRDMERSPDHWFRALGAITGEDPVPPEDEGKVQKMADAWLAFGRDRGYL